MTTRTATDAMAALTNGKTVTDRKTVGESRRNGGGRQAQSGL